MIDLYALAKEKDNEKPSHFRWRIFKLMRFDDGLMWQELNAMDRDKAMPFSDFVLVSQVIDPQEALDLCKICVCYLGEFDYFDGYRKVPFKEEDLL